MKENIIHIPNFYEYLKQEGVDESKLSDLEYSKLRVLYNRHRNRLYKQRQRQIQKEVNIFLTNDEFKLLSGKAKEHELQIGMYIKLSSINYSNTTFLVPNKATLKALLISVQNLERNVQKLAETKTSSIFGNSNKFNQIIDLISPLESLVYKKITQPINLHEWVRNEIIQNKAYRKEIINLILNET